MNWTTLTFGKYAGKSLPQVIFLDPDWFFWACDKGTFGHYPSLRAEAEELYAKATSIRVPQTGADAMLVEYNFYRDGGSAGFDLVPATRQEHQGSTGTMRLNRIDMSVPHRAKGYDKLGNRQFLRSVKSCVFGGPSARMSRELCEAFFDDDTNFYANT